MMAPFIKRVLDKWRVGAHIGASLLLTVMLSGNIARAQTSLADLPFAPQKAFPQWRASTDKNRGNDDYLLLKPRETRRVPLPTGALLRLWFTSSDPTLCDVVLQNGAQKTVLLRGGKTTVGELFAKAWTLYPQNETSTRTLQKLAPNSFLVVKNGMAQEMKFYLQATTDTAPLKRVAPEAKRKQVTSEWTLQPNTSRDFVTGVDSGIIDEIAINYDAQDLRGGSTQTDSQVLNGVRLQARWDDAKELAVDATLAQLAGGWSDSIIPQSAIAKTGSNEYSLRWPMPLPPRRKLSLRNDTKAPINFFITTTIRQSAVPASRFYARTGAETTVPQKPIGLLKVRGAGALVGLNLDMRPQPGVPRQTFVFLEGNEIIRADNRVIEGTGTEDFFNSAWYYPNTPFARDFHGMARKTLAPPGVTTYRWLLPDAIPFRTSLDFTMGHSGRNTTNNMDYRWVVFWYANANSTFEIENNITAPAIEDEAKTSTPADNLANVIKFLPLAFLVIGTLLWLKLSSRRKNT